MTTTIHNVLLVDVQPGAEGFETLRVQINGEAREVVSAGRWNEQYSRCDLGRHGVLVEPELPLLAAPPSAYYFRAYVEPSLRRAFELDTAAGDRGWRCDARPDGFLAPPQVIPGEGGRFVPDQTVQVTVNVPTEFVRECRRVQRDPKQVREGFIGDAAGIQNYVNNPRADRFGSNGSDERDMAEAWIQRAYGMCAIDLDAVEEHEYELEDRAIDREDFGLSLDDYINLGGKSDDLQAAVQVLIDQQRIKAEVGDQIQPRE